MSLKLIRSRKPRTKGVIMKKIEFLLVFFLFLGTIFLSGCNDAPPVTMTKAPRPVFVQPLGLSDGVEQKVFNGVIQSSKAANMAFRVPGTVESVPVIVGQSVTAGEELARLDPHDYEVILVELEAKREEVKASNILAQSEYNRIKQASQNNAIAAVNLDRAQSGVARSEAGLRIVEQNIEKAKDAVSYTVLTAPFDGIVGDVKIRDFEQVLPAIPVIELHQPDNLEAVIDVPENQLARFKTGQSATIQWYGSEEKHSSSVTEISTVSHPIKQTFEVTFSFDKATTGILPGKSVTVSVPLDVGQDAAYCVPFSAVLQNEDDSFIFITSEENHKVMKKQVSIKRIADNELCVEGELEPDQLIVTAGVHYLSEGQEVGQFLKNNREN